VAAEFRLGELARRVGGTVVGDAELPIRGVATLDEAGPHDLSFLTNPRYRDRARSSRAGALLVRRAGGIAGPSLLEVDEPYLALAILLELFHPVERPRPGVSPAAHVGNDVRLGADVRVGPFAVLGDGVVLGDRVAVEATSVVGHGSAVGDDSVLMPGVVLYPGTRVGRRCLIHSGVVLGADGYGFATSGGRHHKLPQLGRVVIEDEVEIGANTTIDRGMLGETVVGAGSKLDDQVMIGHGSRLGRACLLAGQSGVAGSARLGDRVTLAGQSGVAGHLSVAEGTVVAAKSAVFADVEQGGLLAGIPAVPHMRWKRSRTLLGKLPALRRELAELRERVAALERRGAGED
jgi:UDP-3-O-[3-hydroxymyristoyl] glucosamine N-acyltransferase